MSNKRYEQTPIKLNGKPRKRFYLDYIGRKYGQLEVIGKGGMRGHNQLWLCKCHICGKEKETTASQLRPYTKSCGCIRTQRDWNSANWKGVGELSRSRLTSIKNNAKRRSKVYDVTPEYIWSIFLAQDRKCVLSGLSMKFGNRGRDETTASLDRIDSSKGYIEGNVQWVHKHVNAMKLNHSEEYFIELCKIIVEHNKNKSV